MDDIELLEVEKYFGVTYEELGYRGYLFDLMCRIQSDWENGTSHRDIAYYASLYGY